MQRRKLYLLSRVAAGVAREDVAIDVRHTTRPSIIDGRGGIGIRTAIGLVDADDSEIVAIVHHAVKIAGVCAL